MDLAQTAALLRDIERILRQLAPVADLIARGDFEEFPMRELNANSIALVGVARAALQELREQRNSSMLNHVFGAVEAILAQVRSVDRDWLYAADVLPFADLVAVFAAQIEAAL